MYVAFLLCSHGVIRRKPTLKVHGSLPTPSGGHGHLYLSPLRFEIPECLRVVSLDWLKGKSSPETNEIGWGFRFQFPLKPIQ